MHLKYTLKRLKNETKQNIRIFLAHSFTSRLKHQVWTRRNQKSLAAKGKIMWVLEQVGDDSRSV